MKNLQTRGTTRQYHSKMLTKSELVVADEFKSGLSLLEREKKQPRLTTGNHELDLLIGEGIKPGQFYLFYGDNTSGVDFLIHKLLANCLLPNAKNGFNGKALYSNCGNYRKEKTLLDTNLLGSLIKSSKLDPMQALDNIYVICAFSEEQQEQTVMEIRNLLEKDKEIKLVVIHNIAKLFTPTDQAGKKFGRNINRLQSIILKIWQMCAQKNIALVASCRPNKTSSEIPQPEGGKYLRHEANVIVYLRRNRKNHLICAYLRKHPNKASKKIDFMFISKGGETLGRISTPFRTLLQEEIKRLKRSYREALVDGARRDAFDSLLKSWSSEQGAMSYARVPTVLDIMLLTAVVDNRKLIEDTISKVGVANSNIDKLRTLLERIMIVKK